MVSFFQKNCHRVKLVFKSLSMMVVVATLTQPVLAQKNQKIADKTLDQFCKKMKEQLSITEFQNNYRYVCERLIRKKPEGKSTRSNASIPKSEHQKLLEKQNLTAVTTTQFFIGSAGLAILSLTKYLLNREPKTGNPS